jgi:hypothetical protein
MVPAVLLAVHIICHPLDIEEKRELYKKNLLSQGRK